MIRPQDTRFFGHPVGLSTLFFTELWERFGYYGMRALLILFMVAPASTGGLGMDVMTAGSIYGLYTASVYMVSLPGGWLADCFLGQRKAVLYGGILIALGYLLLAAPDVRIFYAGLCVVVCGTGLLKPNISTIVGQLYSPADPRRDAGFSIFYMGINLGATIAPLICGYVGQRINWHLGFALSGLGMSFGVIQYWLGRRHLADAGLHPVPAANFAQAASQRRLLRNALLGVVAIGCALAFVHLTGLLPLTPVLLVNAAGVVLLAIVVALFAWMLLGGDWTPVERKRLGAILVLFVAASIFWAAYEQAGSSLSLFAERSSNNVVLHFNFPASWYQSLNSLFIVALAPLLAWLWVRLGNRQPSSPAKFALGLLFVGLCDPQTLTGRCRCLDVRSAFGETSKNSTGKSGWLQGGRRVRTSSRLVMAPADRRGRMSAFDLRAAISKVMTTDNCNQSVPPGGAATPRLAASSPAVILKRLRSPWAFIARRLLPDGHATMVAAGRYKRLV